MYSTTIKCNLLAKVIIFGDESYTKCCSFLKPAKKSMFLIPKGTKLFSQIQDAKCAADLVPL